MSTRTKLKQKPKTLPSSKPRKEYFDRVIRADDSYTIEDLKARGAGDETLAALRAAGIKPRQFGLPIRYLGREINQFIETLPPATKSP